MIMDYTENIELKLSTLFGSAPVIPLQQSARSRGETFLSKLKLQFQRSATENALLGAQLGGQELLKLTGLPAKLIAALYEHPSVAQRYRDSAGDGYPGNPPAPPPGEYHRVPGSRRG